MQLLKNIFFFFAPKTLSTDRAVILMYHSICSADYFSAVSPQDFERHMRYLAEKKYPVISLAELVRRLKAKEPLGGSVVITFDDGYEDNYSVAFPVLQKYAFPATIFVVTDFIGRPDKRGLMRLSPAQLQELEASGLVSVEPHTKSHPHLSKLPPVEAREEIVGSKQTLEHLLNKRCRFFAYPYGDFSAETRRILQAIGFEASTTVGRGTVGPATNPFDLLRVSVDRTTTLLQFKGLLSTAIDWYESLKLWRKK